MLLPSVKPGPEQRPNLNDLAHFRQPATLRDGTPVLIRAIRPDDISKVVTAFHQLAPESVYTRFFSFKKELSQEELTALGATDFIHAVVLVVARQQEGKEVLIGGGSYHVLNNNGKVPQCAELAFTIEEDYQCQGLSGQLLAILSTFARHQGIQQFEADVLDNNTPMLKVFEHSGLAMYKTRNRNIFKVVLELGQNKNNDSNESTQS
ncbi:hypothetical protein BH11PSE12_BH11PSE12_04360 [soil metagenome]